MRAQLEELAAKACAVLLQDGFHRPILFAAVEENLCLIQPDMDEHRHQLFEAIGAHIAGTVPGLLDHLLFVSEAWLATYPAGESGAPRASVRQTPPREREDRVEVLVVAGYDVPNDEHAALIYQMRRDEVGDLTGVRPYDAPEDGSSHSALLEAFVRGHRAERARRLN
jgi:hypothetical protein